MELRRVERRNADGAFTEIAFADLKKGDEFKLYDRPGGTIYEDGEQVYRALTDAVPVSPEDGKWIVESEPVQQV